MDDYTLWLFLAQLPYKMKIDLLDTYKNPEGIYEAYQKNMKPFFEDGKVISRMAKAWDKTEIQSLRAKFIEHAIQWVFYDDSDYPDQLKLCEDAPYVLFYKGNIKRLKECKSAAIVGSRKCSHYGINVTNLIAKDLSQNGVSIISGMARGIDAAAHQTALDNNGFTCGVLGCGIDVVYPREHKVLYKKVTESGCIISEFLPGIPPNAYHFPLRNRIISGLSNVIVVIEAGEKSGSLITATNGLEQGKEVMAVPGSVFSELSKGTNMLIREGAHVFTSLLDLYQLLGSTYFPKRVETASKLGEFESRIHKIISDKPIHIDDIIRITNIDINQLYAVLFELQLKNEILCLASNYYVKVSRNF